MLSILRVLCGLVILSSLGSCAAQGVDRADAAADDGAFDPERGCTASGGMVSTSNCCRSADNFPNTCAIGACGCGPNDSHEVKTCECPAGTCFDGLRCAGR
jgi:hypothetical protein